jgi:teichuronic acid biosynthesis glycosyltransferase TuaC
MVSQAGTMKVLFVSSGKSGDVGNVVRNQGESLIRYGVDIEYFTIMPGFFGYLKAIPRIHKQVRKRNYDIVHAHYSLSALAASMAGSFPMVVSLMGSDADQNFFLKWMTGIFSGMRWRATIVKTDEMKRKLKLKKAYVIPNGVDTDRFFPVGKEEARQKLQLAPGKKIVLFIAVKNRAEKNLPLAKEAVESLHDETIDFVHLYNTPNTEIPLYLNAADLLLLTSSREGGVNVIKEAMACNCPIVSTDVGDVRWVTSGTEGCFVTGKGHESIAENIKKAIEFKGKTNGRKRIFELGLDAVSVARKIDEVYRAVIGRA